MITMNKVRGLFKEYIENDLRENDFYYYLDKKDINLNESEIIFLALEELDDRELECLFFYIKDILSIISKILEHISYPKVKRYMPYLMQIFQDVNWPGGSGVFEFLNTLDKDILLPYVEETLKKAENDSQWLYFLAGYLEYRKFKEEDFSIAVRPIYQKAIYYFKNDIT